MPNVAEATHPRTDLFEVGPQVEPTRKQPRPVRKSASQSGISPVAILLGALAVAAVLWGLWLTKTVNDLKTERVPIASVRLQPLIEEYVQTQARSGAPEDQVLRQTQAFMAALDAELLRRGREGTTVLVAEAVLSKNVPDVTPDVRQTVYAKLPPAAQAPAAPGGAPMMPTPSALGGSNGQR